jgi:DNA-binding MarR family transcriptional regulator
VQDQGSELHHKGDESHLLKEIMRTHQALLNVFSREVGMPAARLSLMRLLAISNHEKLGVMQIARQLGIDAAAVTRQVKGMGADGLIERFADPRDARRSFVRLTPEGLRLFQQLHERAHEFEKSLTTVVRREEIATTVRVLSQLRGALEAMR